MFYHLRPLRKEYFARNSEKEVVSGAFAAALAILESNKYVWREK